MPELFRRMMVEEWRLHSAIFGTLPFVLFPFTILAIFWMGSILLPYIQGALPGLDIALLAHATFFLMGCMVGGFGLLGNEMMNRRFGEASLLAYSARNLPLSERFIFTNFVVKDVCYYLLLWILPCCLGYIAASPITGVALHRALYASFTLVCAFLAGLSTVFILSTIYTRSKSVCLLLMLGAASLAGIVSFSTGANPALFFPPYLLYRSFSMLVVLLTIAAIAAIFLVSIALFSTEQGNSTKYHREAFSTLVRRLSFVRTPALVSKDLLDLHRSGIAVGHAILAFIVPLVAIRLFISLLEGSLPSHIPLLLFSMITGVIASTFYTWVTEFDSYTQYSSLPIGVGTLIRSKLETFVLLQSIPAAFICIVVLQSGSLAYLLPALALCVSISCFGAGVMAYLCGLAPSVLIYDPRRLLLYLAINSMVLAAFTALSFVHIYLAFLSIFLLFLAWISAKKAILHWDSVDPAGS